jgi:hypothetical protein
LFNTATSGARIWGLLPTAYTFAISRAKLVVDEKCGEILGATMVGLEMTELLPELTSAQMMELTLAEIARNVHAYPTLPEVLMEVANVAEGNGNSYIAIGN